ncbi:MAG: thioredoxin fold domain-containing protein [Thermoguttaceae bacterium]|nr:thioredoxin fold domain-containing protein [Thermoguttaceae bacterium]
MSEILELQETDFDAKVLQETRPVLVDFWSPTCGPCRAFAPVVAALAQANGDSAVIAKANAFETPNLAAKLGVAALPTILIFKNGEVVSRLSGVQKEATLQQLLDANK